MNRDRIFIYISVFGILFLVGCGSTHSSDNTKGTSASLAQNTGNITTTTAAAPIQDPPADLVLGQVDFASNQPNMGKSVNSAGLDDPIAVAIDQSTVPNRVYVSDYNNNRVLGWADVSALTNGSPADLVIGQPDFSTHSCNTGGIGANTLCVPMGIAVDRGGNLYVADRGNSRVLVYFSPFSTDTLADRVLGQPIFTSAGCSNLSPSVAKANALCDPFGVTVDGSGNVFVADMANNRVLEYDTPLATDTVADRVFGQPDFTTTVFGSGATGLNQPYNVAVDAAGNLYVADFRNSRVLEYDNPVGNCLTCDTIADRVFGQPDFTSNVVNAGKGVTAPGDSSLAYPVGMAVDQIGNLYVVDHGNSRVLQYYSPLITDTVGDQVFGQTDFVTNGCNRNGLSAKTLCLPFGPAIDSGNNFWVADFANHRVLRYSNPGGPLPTSDEVTIPSASFHFLEKPGQHCSLQTAVEFSFEKIPGDTSSGDGGHTTNDIVDPSTTVTMTFSDNFVATAVAGTGSNETSEPKAEPFGYRYEYEVLFDCSTMTAHVSPGQNVTISASGTLSDDHTFSGSGVITTHP